MSTIAFLVVIVMAYVSRLHFGYARDSDCRHEGFTAHRCFALDLDVIRDAREDGIPELHQEVQKILADLQDETS